MGFIYTLVASQVLFLLPALLRDFNIKCTRATSSIDKRLGERCVMMFVISVELLGDSVCYFIDVQVPSANASSTASSLAHSRVM